MTPERPRVVIVATDPPWPPTSGGDLRIAAIAGALAASADVTPVVFPIRKAIDADALPPGTVVHPSPLPGRLGRIHLRVTGLVRGRHPFLEHLVRIGGPQALAVDLARIRPDLLVLTYPLTGPFLELAGPIGARLIFDLDTSHRLVDRRQLVASRGSAVLKSALDLAVAGPMERGIADRADEIWGSSPVSVADLSARFHVPVRLVPNTVDVRRYAAYRRPPRSGVCSFVGSFDYGPNRSAALRLVEEILPAVRRFRPDARVRLVGRNPPAAIRRLASAPGVEVFSDVPDPWELLAGHGPLVVPLTAGGGTRLKILEAAAAGIPVVGTRLALEGLDLLPERHVLVADDDDGLAAAVVRTWNDPVATMQRISGALEAIRVAYDVDALIPTLAAALGHPEPDPR